MNGTDTELKTFDYGEDARLGFEADDGSLDELTDEEAAWYEANYDPAEDVARDDVTLGVIIRRGRGELLIVRPGCRAPNASPDIVEMDPAEWAASSKRWAERFNAQVSAKVEAARLQATEASDAGSGAETPATTASPRESSTASRPAAAVASTQEDGPSDTGDGGVSGDVAPPSLVAARLRALGYEAHPAASIFPLLPDAELDALGEDIRRNGLLEPIVLLGGRVLDGRNRLLACERAGVGPRFVDAPPGTNPWRYVWSRNVLRRHLAPDQKAACAAKMLEGELEDARKTAKEKANDARAEKKAKAAQEQPRSGGGKFSGSPSGTPRGVRHGESKARGGNVAAEAVEEVAGVSRRTAERALALREKDPEAAERVAAGEARAAAELRRIAVAEAADKVRGYSLPSTGDGPFGVVVADPPWHYDNPAGSTQRGLVDYPTMSVDEIRALPVERLLTDDAVLFLWTTNEHLESAFGVCRSWGFEPKVTAVWVKDRIGVGRILRHQHEFFLVALRGRPALTLTNQSTVLSAPRGRHSEKPEEFYALVESLCPDPRRLELFARRERKGWFCSGAEVRS